MSIMINIRNFHIQKAHIKKRGFTILETLVAISILVLALTAPLVIVSQALQTSYFSRDQITAYYLAQEAVEYLRNKRDNQGLQENATAEGWVDLVTDDQGSMINDAGSDTIKSYLVRDTNGYVLRRCVGGGFGEVSPCPLLKYNTDAFDPESNAVLYGDEISGIDSIFIREIIVNKPPVGTLNDGTALEDPGVNDPGDRELVVTVNVYWRTQDGSFSKGITIREHLTNWQLEKTPPDGA